MSQRPCYEKPSVVSAKRFVDEGLPALPGLIGSMVGRAAFIGVGIWLAKKKTNNVFLQGLAGAAIIEALLLFDAITEKTNQG
jgi:hypothetical protein